MGVDISDLLTVKNQKPKFVAVHSSLNFSGSPAFSLQQNMQLEQKMREENKNRRMRLASHFSPLEQNEAMKVRENNSTI